MEIEFPWCGLIINTKTLDVKSDYIKMSGSSIRDSLSVDVTSNPWIKLRMKMFT